MDRGLPIPSFSCILTKLTQSGTVKNYAACAKHALSVFGLHPDVRRRGSFEEIGNDSNWFADYCAVHPPSTGNTAPVIMLALSLARKHMALAMSSTCATLPSGIFANSIGPNSGSFAQTSFNMSVSVHVGATAFTRMLYSAHSMAQVRLRWAMAALVVA